jgi:hypothetical protein
MNSPAPVSIDLTHLASPILEECRLACKPDRTEAETARLRLLQVANAMAAAGQDENRPRTHYRTNRHDN